MWIPFTHPHTFVHPPAARGPAFVTMLSRNGSVCPTSFALDSEAGCRYAAAALGKPFKQATKASTKSMECHFFKAPGDVSWAPMPPDRKKPGSKNAKKTIKAICYAGALA